MFPWLAWSWRGGSVFLFSWPSAGFLFLPYCFFSYVSFFYFLFDQVDVFFDFHIVFFFPMYLFLFPFHDMVVFFSFHTMFPFDVYFLISFSFIFMFLTFLSRFVFINLYIFLSSRIHLFLSLLSLLHPSFSISSSVRLKLRCRISTRVSKSTEQFEEAIRATDTN